MKTFRFIVNWLNFFKTFLSKTSTDVNLFIAFFITLPFLILSFYVPRAIAIEDTPESLINYYVSKEDWLSQPSRTNEEIRVGSIELANRYIKDERIQEAIWVLNFGGNINLASILEKRLVKLLSESETEFIEKFEGKEGARLFRVKGTKIYFVEKNRSTYQGGTEVVAFKLNQLLKLNLVPTTIEAINSKGTTVSRQYFIRNSVTAFKVALYEISTELEAAGNDYIDYSKVFHYSVYKKAGLGVNLASVGYPTYLKTIWLLDYLLDNGDRHGQNWLKHFGKSNGRSIPIDHGLCLGGCIESDWKRKIQGPIYSDIKFDENNLPPWETLQTLKSLTHEKLRAEFLKYISEKQIEGIFLRTKRVIAATHHKYSLSRCANLFLSHD